MVGLEGASEIDWQRKCQLSIMKIAKRMRDDVVTGVEVGGVVEGGGRREEGVDIGRVRGRPLPDQGQDHANIDSN